MTLPTSWLDRSHAVGHYDDETRHTLKALAGEVDVPAATAVWEAAVTSAWDGPDVWLHGDVAPGNLLVRGGVLSAVIDFGTCGWGDPSCDPVFAWTVLDGRSRDTFRAAVDADPPCGHERGGGRCGRPSSRWTGSTTTPAHTRVRGASSRPCSQTTPRTLSRCRTN